MAAIPNYDIKRQKLTSPKASASSQRRNHFEALENSLLNFGIWKFFISSSRFILSNKYIRGNFADTKGVSFRWRKAKKVAKGNSYRILIRRNFHDDVWGKHTEFPCYRKTNKIDIRQIFSWISSFAVKPSFFALQHGRSILFLFIQPPRAQKKGKRIFFMSLCVHDS